MGAQGTANGTYVRGNCVDKVIVQNDEIIQVGHHPVDMRWVAMMFEDEQVFPIENVYVANGGHSPITLSAH